MSSMDVTIHRPAGDRVETPLPGQVWWTQTTLLRDLLDWLDRGKSWSDIASDAARDDVAAGLRALADLIEATKTAPPEKGRQTNHPEMAAGLRCSYSPSYGTARA